MLFRSEAVHAALRGPLVEDGAALADAESVLVSILGGPDMAIREVESIMNAIRKVVRKDAHIHMGTAIDEHWRDTISVTIVASQFWREEDVQDEKAELVPETDAAPKAAPGGKRKKRAAATQPQLGFDTVSKGIFKDVEPRPVASRSFFRNGSGIEWAIPASLDRKSVV